MVIGQAICAAVLRVDVSASRTNTLKLLAFLGVFALWFYAWYRNDERRLTRDYSCGHPFEGALEKCLIRFPTGETRTDCVLGVNSEGLYLSSSMEAVQSIKWLSWKRQHSVMRTPILIPWDKLEYGEAKFPLRRYVRFSVPSNKATFFVPRETADLLLGRAGRPRSCRSA